MTHPVGAMTIDELAHQTGTSTSTIRLYQAKGILPPPEKQGCVGYYGHEHLERLRLIAQLQEDGYSLASIGHLVLAWQDGRGLEDVLGLEAQVAKTWGPQEPRVLRPEELAARFPGGELPIELVQRTLELGLIEIEGDRVVVRDPRLLEVGSDLASIGIPLASIIDEFEELGSAMDQIAERFTNLFREHLWEPFASSGFSPEQLPELITSLQRLSQTAESVVDEVLRSALKRSANAFLADQADVIRREGLSQIMVHVAEITGLDVPESDVTGSESI